MNEIIKEFLNDKFIMYDSCDVTFNDVCRQY